MNGITGDNQGIRQLQRVYAQIQDDIAHERVTKKHGPKTGKYSQSCGDILTPFPSVKMLLLEINISDTCQIFTEVCQTGQNLFDAMIGQILDEKAETECYDMLPKKIC